MRNIIYLKIAKTGGTSMVDLLERNFNGVSIYYKEQDVNMPPNNVVVLGNPDTIYKFKTTYTEYYDNAIKIIILRDPFERVLSSYNYMCFSNTLYDMLLNPPDTTDTVNYIHFNLPQLDAICLDGNDIFGEDYVILDYGKLNYDIQTKLVEYGVTKTNIKHLNKSTYNKTTLLDKERELISVIFSEDIIAYNKINK